MTAAPTPSAEELDRIDRRLRSDDPDHEDCDDAADAIEALRQQVAELKDLGQSIEDELTTSRERVERLEGNLTQIMQFEPEACMCGNPGCTGARDVWEAAKAALAPASDAKEDK